MKYAVIFCSELKTKEDFYSAIKKHLELPEYFGCNLDALHDSLAGKKLTLEFHDSKKLTENLGEYGEKIFTMLRELDEESDSFKLREK